MKTIHSQDCPLCGSTAEYQFADAKNCKYYRCGKCTTFQISVRPEKRLIASTAEWRAEYSEMARRAPEGFTLVITRPSVPKQEGAGNPALLGEFVPDSKLPR